MHTNTSYGLYGNSRWVIYNGEVVLATITFTQVNVRGLVHSYDMVRIYEEKDDIGINKRDAFNVPRNRAFKTEEDAKKALFRLKLKGEI